MLLPEVYISLLEQTSDKLAVARVEYLELRLELGRLQESLGDGTTPFRVRELVRRQIGYVMADLNRKRADVINAIRNVEILLGREPRKFGKRRAT